MRFIRLRDSNGCDIHVWVDDGFDMGKDDIPNLIAGILKKEKENNPKLFEDYSDKEYEIKEGLGALFG